MPNFSNVKIVLVSTTHPGNIGASARAMKNMGLNRLTLVQPKDFPSGVFNTPCALIIGTRKESTDEKTSLNDALRTFGVEV